MLAGRWAQQDEDSGGLGTATLSREIDCECTVVQWSGGTLADPARTEINGRGCPSAKRRRISSNTRTSTTALQDRPHASRPLQSISTKRHPNNEPIPPRWRTRLRNKVLIAGSANAACASHPLPLYSQYTIKDVPDEFPKCKKLWITACGPVCAAMVIDAFLPARERKGPQRFVEAALRMKLYDPLDRIREIYMSPLNLLTFCKREVKRVLAAGHRVTSGEIGRAASSGHALDRLSGLLNGGARVLVTSRTCLAQRCSVFDDAEERTSHFLVVARIWKGGDATGQNDSGGQGQVFIELLDPACTLVDDLQQATRILKHGPQPNPSARAVLGSGSKRQKSVRMPPPSDSRERVQSPHIGVQSAAHSLVEGVWSTEAGRYIVDWRAFDLAWNSRPDGKYRWWLALHPAA